MRIQQLGHIALVVGDRARSKDFYANVLGLEVSEDDEDHGGLFMTFGEQGHNVDLFTAEDLAGPEEDRGELRSAAQRVHHFAFRLETFDELRDAYFSLEDNGVEILRAINHESQCSIYLTDPDGNIVELYWERPDALKIFREGRADVDRPLVFARAESASEVS